jgi:murein DD-endopeptidase MepM/ murein hydrolase activator NlpD
MAKTTLLPTPPLNSGNINNSFKTSQSTLTQTQKGVKNISNLLINRTKVRKEIFSSIFEFRRRRELQTVREEREDEIETRKVVSFGGVSSAIQSASAAGGSFLDRIVKAIGFITAGWILRRLPTWIGYAKEFIARVEELGRIIRSFVSNVTNFFSGLFNTLGALKDNLLRFDLFDSERNVRNSFNEVTKSIEGIGNDFQDTMNVFTTDLTKQVDGVRVGSYSGEAVPEQGQGFTPATPDSTGTYQSAPSSSSSGSVSSSDSKLLEFISKGEGGYNSMNQGTSGSRIVGSTHNASKILGKNLTDMTVGEVMQAQSSGKLFAAGRYQIIPSTMKLAVSRSGVSLDDRFDAKTQDKLGLALIYKGQRPILSAYLQGKSNDLRGAMIDLAEEWASAPHPDTGRSAYPPANKSSHTVEEVKQALMAARSGGKTQSQSNTPSAQTSSPTKATSTPTGTNLMGQSYFKPLPQGSFKGGSGQTFGASRDGGRSHLGIDITESNWKPGSDPRIPVVAIMGGTVIKERYVGGSEYLSGLMIRQDDGYDARYLHMSPSAKPGDRVEAGQRIGRLVDLGNQTHLHFELYKGKQVIDPTSYISKIEKGEMPKSQIAAAPSKPSAQISPPTQQRPQAVAQQITPERKVQDIVAVVPPTSQPMQQSMSSQQTQQKPAPSISDMLNNFIKQKFLLDLSYL